MTMLFWLLILSYLVGAIPFGVLVARRRGIDITSVGSGNIGATNVWRTLGPAAGSAVFFLDVMKGLVPAVAAYQWTGRQEYAFLCGAVAVIGHSLSPFIGFRGGKGISTGFGMLLGSSIWVALSAFGVFLALLAASRYVSLASMVAAIAMVVFGWLYGDPPSLVAAYGAMAAFILLRHRSNIARLVQGTERKFLARDSRPNAEERA